MYELFNAGLAFIISVHKVKCTKDVKNVDDSILLFIIIFSGEKSTVEFGISISLFHYNLHN